VQLACGLISILAEVLLREQLLHDRFCLIVDHAILSLSHLLYDAAGLGVIA
jgi:hypothetical protein